MHIRQALPFLGLIGASFSASAQGLAGGRLSGDLQSNVLFFNEDPSINATGTPQYNDYLSGSESWLSLRYTQKDFSAFVRLDGFYNSNLYNPTLAYNGVGLGAVTLTKTVGDLQFTGGYIYDQIGSGILFRAYEDRGLLIDNALIGLHVRYKPSEHFTIKGFVGNQKNTAQFGKEPFARREPVIKGINAEGDYHIGNDIQMTTGVGVLNRTIDQISMDGVAGAINSQPLETRFVPKYNMYAGTIYNTLNAGAFSLYTEAAYKTHEAILRDGFLQDLKGTVLYSTLSYAHKGYAITLNAKRTQNFEMRTSPNEVLLAGLLNWQPIIARIRPQRLIARYSPASQNLSELAFGGDILVAPNDNVSITLNYTHINSIEGLKLYREVYAEVDWRNVGQWDFLAGVQRLTYNRFKYQVNPSARTLEALTPFVEGIYHLNSKKSLRVEAEYMITDDDLGPQAFLLMEYNVAPRWSLALSDMYLIKPSNESAIKENKHFYQIFGAYTQGPHRFTAAYVKQVEGINCTGGVCRYEPAFSGVRFGITSSF